MTIKKISSVLMAGVLALSLAGCATTTESSETATTVQAVEATTETVSTSTESSSTTTATTTSTVAEAVTEGSMLDTSDMFTDRDLEQTADLTEATAITVTDDTEINITEEGVYLISGEAANSTIIVEADDEAKVQLVLDGVSVTNDSLPVIYVKSADKVFVTTTDSDNYMEVSGEFTADGDTNLDAVIFSKDDLVLNGTGSLEVVSAEGNGITSKDDLKITGGTITVDAEEDGLEANDSIRIYDGVITVDSDKDAIHSENEDDLNLGYIYIQGGVLNLSSADDAIRGNSVVQIDGGEITIESCTEGIEGTYVQINGGTIDIYSTDDGINASDKSDYDIMIEINGGDIHIVMSSGDTDAIDSNGDIYINGGTIDLECSSSFDVDAGTIVFNDGEVTINGEVVTEISASSGGRSGRGH